MLLFFLSTHNNISNHHLALKPCGRLSVHKFPTSVKTVTDLPSIHCICTIFMNIHDLLK